MQEHMGNVSRKTEIKKESKGNSKNEKHTEKKNTFSDFNVNFT